MRLDQALVARKLVATRSKARDVILRGLVTVNGHAVEKPGALVGGGATVEVPAEAVRFVSRGGVKLAAAMDAFGLDAADRICLDVGASTGGFTQVALERGAARVYAVDVGRDQLHETLRDNPRVVRLEQTDARLLTSEQITDPIDAIVADVSFISLTRALAVPLSFAHEGAWLAALIKPQFEVGRGGLGKGGIVRNEAARDGAVAGVRSWLASQPGWSVVGVVPSPITGGSGNEEFLIGARFAANNEESQQV